MPPYFALGSFGAGGETMSVIYKTLACACAYIGLQFAAGVSSHVEPLDQFDPTRVVVLATSTAPELAKTCAIAAGVELEGVWQPSQSDLTRLQSKLSSLLVDFRNEHLIPKMVLRPNDYYLQMCPIVGSEKRIIFISGFHKALMGNKSCVKYPRRRMCSWRTQILGSGHSGGKQFWATYDLNKDQVERLTFDGAS